MGKNDDLDYPPLFLINQRHRLIKTNSKRKREAKTANVRHQHSQRKKDNNNINIS
jgi:hypothetical protein